MVWPRTWFRIIVTSPYSCNLCCRRQELFGRGGWFSGWFVTCYRFTFSRHGVTSKQAGDEDNRVGDKKVPDSAKQHCLLGIVFNKDRNELKYLASILAGHSIKLSAAQL